MDGKGEERGEEEEYMEIMYISLAGRLACMIGKNKGRGKEFMLMDREQLVRKSHITHQLAFAFQKRIPLGLFLMSDEKIEFGGPEVPGDAGIVVFPRQNIKNCLDGVMRTLLYCSRYEEAPSNHLTCTIPSKRVPMHLTIGEHFTSSSCTI